MDVSRLRPVSYDFRRHLPSGLKCEAHGRLVYHNSGAQGLAPARLHRTARLRERRLRGARRSDQTGGSGLGRGRDNTVVDVVEVAVVALFTT